MKKFVLLLCIFLQVVACSSSDSTAEQFVSLEKATSNKSEAAFSSPEMLFAQKADDEMVEGKAKVIKLLPDDNKGSRHQKFLVELASGQTLLFAHNIDLAARIDRLQVGDEITFRGEYSYNPKGGLVHWTHHDPQGSHEAGWIQHKGIVYQ